MSKFLVSNGKFLVSNGKFLISSDKINVETKYNFKIIPSPSNAIVKMNGIETNIISVPSGTNVAWSVEADGYITQSGNLTITKNELVNVVLSVATRVYVEGDILYIIDPKSEAVNETLYLNLTNARVEDEILYL